MSDPDLTRWSHPNVTLVATDLHDLDRLMPFAVQQVRENNGRLILLHVVASTAALTSSDVGLPYYDVVGLFESADRALLPWCESARYQGIACDALVREGNPAQQVAAAARQFHADCVLLGTRSRSKLSKLLLGSVAEQVLRSVKLPVITVGPEAHLPVDGGGEQVVLHATTLRETSRPSAALACRIAAGRKQKLVLLHVMPPLDEMMRKKNPAELDTTAARELFNLAVTVGAEKCAAVEPVVMHGNPSIEILATAEERHASLIVLGATNRSAFENLTRDRTVYRVLAHARCPVLTLSESRSMAVEGHKEQEAALHG